MPRPANDIKRHSSAAQSNTGDEKVAQPIIGLNMNMKLGKHC